MSQPFTVAKSVVECYKIRQGDSGLYWADITIDAYATTGRIQIASDYGSWQNFWGACGVPFKQFLSTLSFDYAASKFGVQEWIDVEGTLRFYKELVIGYRRDETLTAEEARTVFDEIISLDSEDRLSLPDAVLSSAHLLKFLHRMCGMPEFIYEPDLRFKHFWEIIWPVLLAEFTAEASLVTASAA